MDQRQEKLKLIQSSIQTVPDYPKPGILFRDITSLLASPTAFTATVELLVEHYRDRGINKVIGTEARGFIFGAPVALALNVGFIPVRKPNKLPRAVMSEEYALEYGTNTLEIHTDAINPNDKILIVDDLLATGGTIAAAVSLVRRLGGEVSDAAFVLNLPDLGGKEKLTQLGIDCLTLVDFVGH